MKQIYSGGCHCGAVRFEADIDFSKGTFRCNCSICGKGRTWLTGIGASDFRLLKGEDALTDYQFGQKRIHHYFCKHCGIKTFGRAPMPDGSQGVAVVVTCLENVSDAELASLPIAYLDGRRDNFQAAPAETRHL